MNWEEKRKILELAGFGVDSAVNRFLGDTQMYLMFLEKFEDDENLEQLYRAIEEKDVEEAFSHAHTIKGVAANLGIDCILKELVPIVEILRRGSLEGVAERIGLLQNMYNRAFAAIDSCKEY